MKTLFNRSKYISLNHFIQNQNNVNTNLNILKLKIEQKYFVSNLGKSF